MLGGWFKKDEVMHCDMKRRVEELLSMELLWMGFKMAWYMIPI